MEKLIELARNITKTQLGVYNEVKFISHFVYGEFPGLKIISPCLFEIDFQDVEWEYTYQGCGIFSKERYIEFHISDVSTSYRGEYRLTIYRSLGGEICVKLFGESTFQRDIIHHSKAPDFLTSGSLTKGTKS